MKKELKYYMADSALDAQVSDIRRRIRLAMNGVVSEQMTRAGAVYKQNYGVSVLTLREMARRYTPNRDLAQRLWALGIRETMILATHLYPPDTFTPDDAAALTADFNQVELVEQACMNLLSRMPQAEDVCRRLLETEGAWQRVTAFTLAARIADRLTDDDVRLLTDRGTAWSATDNLFLYKAIALALASISRRGRETAEAVAAAVAPLGRSPLTSQRYIAHEVTEEIAFLDFL